MQALRHLHFWLGGLCCLLAACSLPDQRVAPAGSETEQVAEAAWSVGDYEEAARLFERASERDPGSFNALVGLGKSYTGLGQFNRAENALRSAAALRPRNPAVHAELGKLALHQGQPEAAIASFDAALQADRRHLAALTGKAVSLDYLSRHAEAQEVYRKALSFYPTNFALLSNFALSQVLSGQHEAGIALMEELLRDSREGATVRANMAIAYGLSGRVTEARTMLKGVMSEPEIKAELKLYAAAREKQLAGEPIGAMIFE